MDVLPFLFQVSFCSCYRLEEVFAHQLRCESGPGGKKSGVNGLGPGMHYWAESTSVEALDQICLGSHFVFAAGKGFEVLGGQQAGAQGDL